MFGVKDVWNQLVVISANETPHGHVAPINKDLGVNQ